MSTAAERRRAAIDCVVLPAHTDLLAINKNTRQGVGQFSLEGNGDVPMHLPCRKRKIHCSLGGLRATSTFLLASNSREMFLASGNTLAIGELAISVALCVEATFRGANWPIVL